MPTGDNQPGKLCSDDDFLRYIKELGPAEYARRSGGSERNVHKRIRNLERNLKIRIVGPNIKFSPTQTYPGRLNLEVENGSVLIGGDFHIWPGPESTALRAFKKLVAETKPKAVILNGDIMDCPQISRHPPMSWESLPALHEELEAAQDHLNDIAKAAGRARKIWLLGNHDQRFETRLATVAPEFKKIHGVHLSDHFGLWEKGWSCLINDRVEGGATMVKHIPVSMGENSLLLNVRKSGISVVNNHAHRQNLVQLSDYRHFDLYGVDSGMIGDKEHAAFEYTQDSPKNWRSGFVEMTYSGKRHLAPQLATKWDDKTMQFKGSLVRV
jgi:hypothetical protein